MVSLGFWLVWSIILETQKQNYKTIKYFSTSNKRKSKYTPHLSKPNLYFQNTVYHSRQQKGMAIDLCGSSWCYVFLVSIILILGSW